MGSKWEVWKKLWEISGKCQKTGGNKREVIGKCGIMLGIKRKDRDNSGKLAGSVKKWRVVWENYQMELLIAEPIPGIADLLPGIAKLLPGSPDS